MSTSRFPSEEERARRAQLLALLDEGKVLLQVNVAYPGVDLPEHLREELAVGLAVSRRFGLPVLELGPFALRASLSFRNERYVCEVPWPAIFAMRSYVGAGQAFYPESVPTEIIAGLELARGEPASVAPAPAEPAPVAEEVAEEGADEGAIEAAAPRLRLVEP